MRSDESGTTGQDASLESPGSPSPLLFRSGQSSYAAPGRRHTPGRMTDHEEIENITHLNNSPGKEPCRGIAWTDGRRSSHTTIDSRLR